MIHDLDPWSWKVMSHRAKMGAQKPRGAAVQTRLKPVSFPELGGNYCEGAKKNWLGPMEIAIKTYSVYEELGKAAIKSPATSSIQLLVH